MRRFKQYGKLGWHAYSVRFADGRKEGVATCAYNHGMSDEERIEMARRITAALNATAHLTVEQIEAMGNAASSATPWPKQRDVGRLDDMHPGAHLRVGLDADNDVYVSIWNGEDGANIEFCCPGAGDGKSPRTREALVALMVAMEADNADSPGKDWWALRNGVPAQSDAD